MQAHRACTSRTRVWENCLYGVGADVKGVNNYFGPEVDTVPRRTICLVLCVLWSILCIPAHWPEHRVRTPIVLCWYFDASPVFDSCFECEFFWCVCICFCTIVFSPDLLSNPWSPCPRNKPSRERERDPERCLRRYAVWRYENGTFRTKKKVGRDDNCVGC